MSTIPAPVPHVIHVATVSEHAHHTVHQDKINAALEPWRDGWQITLQHSVTCLDTVFTGESAHGFNGTGWLYSTLILVSRYG